KYPQHEIESIWKQLLTLQDCNVLSGTAIADAYDDVHRTYSNIQQTTSHLIDRAANVLTDSVKKRGQEDYVTLFNPLAWERSEYVVLSVRSNEKQFTVLDDKGAEIDHQVLERGKNKVALLCYIPHILPLSFVGLAVYPGVGKSLSASQWKISQRIIESPFYKIRFDRKGGVSSLYDKQARRELIKKGKRGNILQTFVDKPKQWEAWDIDADYHSKQTHLFHTKSVKLVERGPLRVVLRLDLRSSGTSRLTQDMILYHQSRRIDFVTDLRWFEKQTLLKVAFPLEVKSHMPTYEIQFGAISRTSRPTTSWDEAKFEVPAQRWADLSDAKGGVSLLNDSKYGYDAHGSTLRLTLLRSPHFAHPTEPAKLTDNRLSDQGDHHCTYALLPHQGDWRKARTVRHAKEFNNPILIFYERSARRIPPLVSTSHANIVIETIKKAEDSDEIVLRIYEAHGEQRDTTLEFGSSILKAFECDLMENVLNNLKASKTKLKIKFKPFEIKTLKVALKPQSART
ncbi:MAG: alpha-mannosidase, partial [Bacteroidota bacterium]